MEIISRSTSETLAAAEAILAVLKKKNLEARGVDKAIVVGLVGDLGSGKTTFSQYVAQKLGVVDTVTSPTFIIEKIYTGTDTTFPHLVHIDAYRLDEGRDLSVLGFEGLLKEKRTLILVEWPERVRDILPADTLMVNFKFIDESTRLISYDF